MDSGRMKMEHGAKLMACFNQITAFSCFWDSNVPKGSNYVLLNHHQQTIIIKSVFGFSFVKSTKYKKGASRSPE